ncbi:glycerate kinase [Paraferrimonas sp. SM1919]|uniref:glycerate kinase n=1 Tax=Paraferrimonas sp. SM1919 TaxID=2662263 RepID=UPI0013D08131|nr:glycerate kinase [Paraferrimonas sp. SM1919]
MKVIIAPDSFKECASALDIAKAIKAGWLSAQADTQCTLFPMADGGEGTVAALIANNGKLIEHPCQDPLGQAINGFYGQLQDGIHVVEVAAASGLERLTTTQRNPLITSTYGSGELIKAALAANPRKIILGLGGSATNDAGMGLLTALGARFLDEDGQPLNPGGAELIRLAEIDLSELDNRLQNTEILVACDVDNPLLGHNGASHIFGPQKGATPEQVKQLDAALAQFHKVVKTQFNLDLNNAGAGAAGGLGAGLQLLPQVTLQAGAELLMDHLGFNDIVTDADLLIVAEGRLDGQSIQGKTPTALAKRAKKINPTIKVLALAGSLGEDVQQVLEHGIDAYYCITPEGMDLPQALAQGLKNCQQTAYTVAQNISLAV